MTLQAQTQTLHHLNPPVSKKKKKKNSVYTQLRNSHHYSAASYSQRLCEATHINASLPPAAAPSTTTRPQQQLKTFPRLFFSESAHRQYYLISIELFQMKRKDMSHSPGFVSCPGAVCRLAFMIHMLPVWKFCSRPAEPPLLSGPGPPREQSEKGKFCRLLGGLRLHRSLTILSEDIFVVVIC